MTADDIQLIKNIQNKNIAERKKLEEVKQKILELEQDPKIKEYFKLIQFVKNVDENKLDKNFYDSISKIASYTKESNNLLYDYGYISILTSEIEEGLEYDYENSACIHVYRDLETTDYYIELIKNEIESIPIEWRIGNSTVEYENRKKYNALRNYFIEQLLIRPQEEVVEELLKNNKKLIKIRGGSFGYENK